MQEINLSKPLRVEVFDDKQALDDNAWIQIGDYENLADAIDTCKEVIDWALCKPRYSSLAGNALLLEYLNYGPIPCIHGVNNLDTFDPYEYVESKARQGRQWHWGNTLGLGL